ncbi:Na+/H+ antiporter subunit E [Planctomycetota bacterium]
MLYLIRFSVFYLFWLILSGHFDMFHLLCGAFCSLLVTYISGDLLLGKSSAKSLLPEIIRFIIYVPWLIWQIILANFYVAYLVLHPKMPINPRIISFKTSLKKDNAKTTLANSITLTPGTITILIKDLPAGQTGSEYRIHALNKKIAEGLLKGTMLQRVAKVFGEAHHA